MKDKKIHKLTQEELAKLHELENEPQACGINHNTNVSDNQPATCSIKSGIPQTCSIARITGTKLNQVENNNSDAPTHPNTCSIDTDDYKSQKNPEIPSQESRLIDRNKINILDTYGYNVPVTEETRKKLLKQIKDNQEKLEIDGKTIFIVKNGPYIVEADIPIIDEGIKINDKGQSIGWQDPKTLKSKKGIALCRCGHSKNPPFCDESHIAAHFDGTCTASNTPYDEAAAIYEGCPNTYLMDEESLCAIVRFCDPDGSCWNLVKSDETIDTAIDQTYNCASGRLTVIRDGKKLEPELEKEITCIYDTERKVLGPLWVKNYIEVKSDTTEYETRNRVTLCRCGRSYNKPFCDGMHLTCQQLTEEEIKENE